MIDRDLAELYGVETRVLNQAVKRNSDRFPEEFMFQFTKQELENWKSQNVTSNKEIMGLRKLPFVITEQGVSMLSAVLKSDTAVQMSIQIINTFVNMRKFISSNADMFQRFERVAQISFAEAYDELKPDILIVLGDRYEIFSAVSAAMITRIPIAHLHGGETTEGAFDESIRHSITKMSHLHFTAAQEYRNRVIQLGEYPERVFNVGGLGIENIKRLTLLNKEAFEESTEFKLGKKNILVTFHPVTLENSTASSQFQELLDAIDGLEETNIIFTKANSDTDGRVINQMIDEYVAKNPHKSVGFTSLGQVRYLSALQFVDAVVGNSSSGLAEAPSFKIGTINIGDRQKGRIKAKSVIDCEPNKNDIKKAFEKLYSQEFQANLEDVKNPYGDGCASLKIIKEIKKTELGNILKKSFFNVEFKI